jgi:7-cyano-7-deazaguanine synthase in queuosine biosynthesis
MILFLFSGGVESTALLKYFLKDTDKLIYVLYTKLGYDDLAIKRIKEQDTAAKEILTIYRKKYRDFNYGSTNLSLNNINRSHTERGGFGYDEQWNLFFAGMYAKMLGIKEIWLGHFTYNQEDRIKNNMGFQTWFYDGTLEKYASLGTSLDFGFTKDLTVNFPAKTFNKKKIDSFSSKKEAWDYIDEEVRPWVRSCWGEEKFCGKCYKCITYIKSGIKND